MHVLCLIIKLKDIILNVIVVLVGPPRTAGSSGRPAAAKPGNVVL
jgi:hypothetical protein